MVNIKSKEASGAQSTEAHSLAYYLKKNPKNGTPMSKGKTKFDENTVPVGSIQSSIEENSKKKKKVVHIDEKTDLKLHKTDVLPNAPQIRLVDGRIALDEESLVTFRKSEHIDREHVEETQKYTTSASFRKRTTPRDRWSAQEEKLLYEGLSVWGTDFGIISHYLKSKTREQIKNKFKKEERIYPSKIRDALSEKKPFDESIFNSIKH